jgi:hypothetical protein
VGGFLGVRARLNAEIDGSSEVDKIRIALVLDLDRLLLFVLFLRLALALVLVLVLRIAPFAQDLCL